jgi:hypothetical protein
MDGVYRAYNLTDLARENSSLLDGEIDPFDGIDSIFRSREAYVQRGEAVFRDNTGVAGSALKSFVMPNGVIDGSKLQSHWFPQTKADVFISHSHGDLDLAMALAGWLSVEFKLRPFIDSAIWGDSDALLKDIDNVYCKNIGEPTYSYERRNRSTSIVHMMLTAALGTMIDNTECLIFLNTPRSLKWRDEVERTESPWIYAEICMVNSVRLRLPERKPLGREILAEKFAKENRDLIADFLLPMQRLTPLGEEDLMLWQKSRRAEHALDDLYRMMTH